MAHHVGVRYVIDIGVALKLLAQEPHLRSVLVAERYVSKLNSPDALTEAMSDGLLAAQARPEPGDVAVQTFDMLDFTVRSVPGGRQWSAQWEAHGVLL